MIYRAFLCVDFDNVKSRLLSRKIGTVAIFKKKPFGGGVGAGVKVTPIAFLIVKEGSVRMLPVAAPANTTADRIVEMVPDTLDKIVSVIDSHIKKKEE